MNFMMTITVARAVAPWRTASSEDCSRVEARFALGRMQAPLKVRALSTAARAMAPQVDTFGMRRGTAAQLHTTQARHSRLQTAPLTALFIVSVERWVCFRV